MVGCSRLAVATRQGYAVVDTESGAVLVSECLLSSVQLSDIQGARADPNDYITTLSFGWEYMKNGGIGALYIVWI